MHIKLIVNAIQQFEHAAITVPRVVVGGTPSFLTDLECLAPLGLSTKVYLSPGTWVYNDTQTNEILPGKFHLAAFILAQVIDKGRANTATLNLGYKRWSIDQGPIDCFSVSGMQAVRWSEEHTVVTYPENMKVNIGDYILIAPRHVCSTVNLWEQMAIIGPDGRIENIAMPIHGRNR